MLFMKLRSQNCLFYLLLLFFFFFLCRCSWCWYFSKCHIFSVEVLSLERLYLSHGILYKSGRICEIFVVGVKDFVLVCFKTEIHVKLKSLICVPPPDSSPIWLA